MRCRHVPVVEAYLCISILAATWPATADERPVAAAPVGTVAGTGDWITALDFRGDGTVLAAGTYDAVLLIDAASREVTSKLKTRNGYVRGLAFSPDGTRIAVGDYQSVSIWESASARCVAKLAGHTGYVTAVVFAGERLVSGSDDGTVRVWEPASQKCLQTIDVGVPVNDVAVAPRGELLAIAIGDATRPNRAGQVVLKDLETGETVAELTGHERATLSVAFSKDGSRLASAGEDEKVNLHDVAARKSSGFYAGHSRSVNDVVFADGDDILASVSGGNAGGLCELRVWKGDGTELFAVEPHTQRISSIAMTQDGLCALGSRDGSISLWDLSAVLDDARAARRSEPVEARRPASTAPPEAP